MDQNPDISEQRSEAIWQHRAEMALASVIAADRLITYAELAERMDVPLGTMKSWIRRGLAKLKGCMEMGE